MIITDKYVFFYGGIYSQWYPCRFEQEGVQKFNGEKIVYNCTEQFMMAGKAILFNDFEMYSKIMSSDDPHQMKMEYGRNVKNFDVNVWNSKAKDIVYEANYLKFTQNPKLLKHMKSTGNRMYVEASPTDKIWGIGLAEHDNRIYDPKNWRGTNWLGEVLTKLRNDLKDY